ncbi:MAG: hypothetical protein ABIN97_17790 [Ginsengibacter sp.]
MKHHWRIYVIICIALFNFSRLYSQNNIQTCKVEAKDLIGTYAGECKNGFAHGKGEAKGINQYVGTFRYGLPDGKGTYYYNDNVYYNGYFQEGLKEGKGETHYKRDGMVDSLVKGYWSANEYRGKTYKTYNVTEMPSFDRADITPSEEAGNTLTIEISTTSSQPSSQYSGAGYLLSVINVIAKDGSYIRKLETPINPAKFSTTYELSQFPVRLLIALSNGRTISLELYKKAKWSIQLFINK